MPRHPWVALASAMSREDADMLLQDFKRFKIDKSDLSHCHVCMLPAPHAMRVQLLRCISTTCSHSTSTSQCQWRARVLRCSMLPLVTVEEAYTHVTSVRSPRKPHMTAEMKKVAQDWAAQGLKAKRIWDGLIQSFSLDEASTPPLASVQRLVHYHVTGRLGGSDLLGVVRSKIRDTIFSGREEETTSFTICWSLDSEGIPVVGNGSDSNPFVVGVTTKKLLRQADRDPGSFILHLDATYKLTQSGYPVIVVGISDRARRFHPLALFIVSQQQQPHFTEVLRLLKRTFEDVTGKSLRVRFAMGDADTAQWNALHEVFGQDPEFCFLMCYFHVAKKIFEKTRSLPPTVGKSVMTDLHYLHYTLSETEYLNKLADIQERWAKVPEMKQFISYFSSVWLNQRVWRWQCFHTPCGFATTNNPCESYNAAIKRDVTLRRKLKMGTLLDQLRKLCESESIRSRPFANTTSPDARLIRRATAMHRDGLLLEKTISRNSIAFLVSESEVMDASNIVRVESLPSPRIYDEDRRRTVENVPVSAQLSNLTAMMERYGMPKKGWAVDVDLQTCPCRYHFKFGSCIHILFALKIRGNADLDGRETLVYRGVRKRPRNQRTSRPLGRPTNNGSALSLD